MPRFYSPEWVDAFNEAVSDLDLGAVDTGASLVADGGSFRVAQVVRGGPDGELVVTMAVDGGRLALELVPPDAGPETPDASPETPDASPETPDAGPEATASVGRDPNVTIVLSYEDAAAMSRGQLDPADAISEGRVRVRGDLAVLVAAQSLLAAAADRLEAVHAETSY